MKKIFFILAFAALVFPHSSHAQVDARCWYKDDCIAARKELKSGLTPEELEKGFVQNAVSGDVCKAVHQTEGNPIGFCLPSTNAKIKIAIGGQTEFTGLAEFIAFIYKYGMGLAGILSVLVLIFAGVQWIISGGNAETISKAKHKIVGAVIGMIILAAAYTILYTVNPDLVNLRPPNAWMINTLNLPTDASCLALKPNEKVSRYYLKTADKTPIEKRQEIFATLPQSDWLTPTSTFVPDNSPIIKTVMCGYDYFIEKTNALVCQGTACRPGGVCMDLEKGKPSCVTGNIAGNISGQFELINGLLYAIPLAGSAVRGIAGDGFVYPWVESHSNFSPLTWGQRAEIFLTGVCNSGELYRVNDDNLFLYDYPDQGMDGHGTGKYLYQVRPDGLKNSIENCSNENGFKGFLLAPCMNAVGEGQCERHLIGKPLKNDNTEDTSKNYTGIDLSTYEIHVSDETLKRLLANLKKEMFFSEIEITDGIKLDLNVSLMKDVDVDQDWKDAYDKYFNTPFSTTQ